jgi:hypothetical protein
MSDGQLESMSVIRDCPLSIHRPQSLCALVLAYRLPFGICCASAMGSIAVNNQRPLLADSRLSMHLGDDGTDLPNFRIAMCEFCTMPIDPSFRLVDSGTWS